MKKCSSLVWRFFDRIENENKRCLAVLCKLCDTQYKFFGNTTNLRSHLTNKHPLQWELAQNGTLDDTNFRVEEEESNQSSPKRRKYSRGYNKDKNVRYSVSVDNPRNSSGGKVIPKIEIQRIDVLENSDIDNEQTETEETEAAFNLVRHLHDTTALQGSDEEWLEDEYTTYEPKRKKMTYRKIKREVKTPPRRSSFIRAVKVEKPAPAPIVIDNSNYKDEYSVFGEYVANKLRKFKTPRTRGNLQQLITTILWQAEYGQYDSPDSVKKLLMYSVQEPTHEHNTTHEFESHVQNEEVIIREDEPNQSLETES